jgi:hypothetical protein
VGSIGSFRGGASDIASPRESTALFAAAFARAGLHASLAGPFYLEAHLDVGYTFTPIRIDVDGADAYRLPVLSAGLGARAGVLF